MTLSEDDSKDAPPSALFRWCGPVFFGLFLVVFIFTGIEEFRREEIARSYDRIPLIKISHDEYKTAGPPMRFCGGLNCEWEEENKWQKYLCRTFWQKVSDRFRMVLGAWLGLLVAVSTMSWSELLPDKVKAILESPLIVAVILFTLGGIAFSLLVA